MTHRMTHLNPIRSSCLPEGSRRARLSLFRVLLPALLLGAFSLAPLSVYAHTTAQKIQQAKVYFERATKAHEALLEKPAAKRRRPKKEQDNSDGENSDPLIEGSLEDQVIHAVTQIQEAATEQSQRLRKAIREAILCLQKALED